MTKKATHTKSNPSTGNDQSPNAQDANLCAGEVLIDLALASINDEGEFTPPSVIKITPFGKTHTRDGRAFDFDPTALVARFEKDKIDLAVDLEHSQSSIFGDKKEGAYAWINKLEARTDGTYAHVEWLERGITVLRAKSHRYVSPTFRHDQFGKATWLHSVALTASPALADMPAIASSDPHNNLENNPMSVKLAQLAAALGVTTDASEEAMLTALNTKLENTVALSVHDETLEKLSAAEKELTDLKEAGRVEKLNTIFEDALKAKKMLPAEREEFERLAATDEGLASVEKILQARPAALAASALDATTFTGSDDDDGEIDPVQLAAEAQTYVSEMASKNVQVPIDRAIEHVKKQRKSA